MKNLKYILCVLFIWAYIPVLSQNISTNKSDSLLPSILDSIRVCAIKNENFNINYKNNINFNGKIDIVKRNILLKVHPYHSKIKKGEKQIIIKGNGSTTYADPNICTINLNYYESNNLKSLGYIKERIIPLLHSTIYDSYIYGIVLSPITSKGEKYYDFRIVGEEKKGSVTYYTISFTPKFKSEKLSDGHMTVSSDNWSVRNYFIVYKSLLFSVNNSVTMGSAFTPEEFLPVESKIDHTTKYAGNKLVSTFTTKVSYTEITKEVKDKEVERTRNRDLSILFNKKSDTIYTKLLVDTSKIELYKKEGKDTTYKKVIEDFEKAGRFLTKEFNIDMAKYGEIEMHSIFSPILFDFSTSNGISYKQQLLYTKMFNNSTKLSIQPHIGYNFKYKELLWGIAGNYNYLPKKMGKVSINMNRGNRIKLDTLEYNSNYLRASHSIEAFNGFNIGTIFAINNYQQRITKNSNISKSDLTEYRSYIGEIDLSYTPGQYYYYNKKSKVYLHSNYPTFKVNYAYAFDGKDRKNIKIVSFQSLEFDIHQQLKIGPLHKLSYRFGIGAFFNYSNLHLAEFEYMRKNDLPQGWNDTNAGRFHLLTDINYNDIKKYIRMNLKYDAPFLLVPILFKHVPIVVNERLYYNMLLAPNMKPFVEFGYGIGTFIANIGIFWGGEINKMNKVGVKLTVELFNNFY